MTPAPLAGRKTPRRPPTRPRDPVEKARYARAHRPVSWLRPFYGDERAFFNDFVQTAHDVDKFLPFSFFEWRQGRRLRPRKGSLGLQFLGLSDAELDRMRRQAPSSDMSEDARVRRMALEEVGFSRRMTRAVRAFGGGDAYVAAARAERERYLASVDEGMPLAASAIIEATARVPNCLAHLGLALPSAEAVALARRFEPILEVGAGFGLVARALHQSGARVVATDLESARTGDRAIGFAFPVFEGVDARETIGRAEGWTRLALWPEFTARWILDVVEAVPPGDVVLIASPELEFWLRGGMTDAHRCASSYAVGERLLAMLEGFKEIGSAPLPTSAPGDLDIQLRAWRRRAADRPRAARWDASVRPPRGAPISPPRRLLRTPQGRIEQCANARPPQPNRPSWPRLPCRWRRSPPSSAPAARSGRPRP